MNIIPPPVLPELSATEPQSVAGATPVSSKGTSDNTAQPSFPAVLAQANQQGAPPKPPPSVKEHPQAKTSTTLAKGDAENVVTSGTEGNEALPSPLTITPVPQPGFTEGTPLPSDNALILALTTTLESGAPSAASPTGSLSVEVPELHEGNLGNVKVPVGFSVPPSNPQSNPAITVALPGVVNPVTTQDFSSTNRPVISQISQGVSLPAVGEPDVPPLEFAREPQVSGQPGSRSPLPSIPLSFVNGGNPQAQPLVAPGTTFTVATTLPQNIQVPLPASPGTPSAAVHDPTGNTPLTVLADVGEEAGGSSLGFEQRGHQENGTGPSHKQHAPVGHMLGGSSVVTDATNEFRVSESQSGSRSELVADRMRTLNMSSPQRLQMEVMLADETKVQVDVAVKQQQVSAQLMTDQMMLRNLAIQHEPQLDAQLSSVGLELKQFGAEVSEHGLFGQHLSDPSGQNSETSGDSEASVSPESDILVGAGVDADGRLHYVA